ncbi:MAG: hypothetical protein K2G65_00060 [Eubacterium sp.]|nr:hypothetical protein [Eubacterium sp.]
MKHKSLNREINKYIIDVKSYLICDWRTRQKFLKDLKNDINDFVDEKEDVTMDDIRDRFGEPEKISRSFLEGADLKKIKRRMNFGRTIIVGVIAALLIWLGVLLFTVIHPYVEEPKTYMVEYMHDETVEGEVIGGIV